MTIQKVSFNLPEELQACCPAERRGLRRDHVRLMVTTGENGEIVHERFHQIGRFLRRDDVLVLNTSRTIPASLKAVIDGLEGNIEIRLARRCAADEWEAVSIPMKLEAGVTVTFFGGLQAKVLEREAGSFLQRLKFTKSGLDLDAAIYHLGEPIRYEYIEKPWPLDYYQTVFAAHPGSVEMPSAGRAFTWELLQQLKKKGVKLEYVQLHTGLSDFPGGTPKENPEAFSVPEKTMDTISKAKAAGGRVIAVGTTVVRALETAARGMASGWTRLYIGKWDELKVTDGILTGFHEPEASHLDMLSAFMDQECLLQAYEEAVSKKYLWHEFGDMNLILPT